MPRLAGRREHAFPAHRKRETEREMETAEEAVSGGEEELAGGDARRRKFVAISYNRARTIRASGESSSCTSLSLFLFSLRNGALNISTRNDPLKFAIEKILFIITNANAPGVITE